MRASHFCLSTIALILSGWVSAADLYVVDLKQTRIYDGPKAAGALYEGEIISATPVSADWLQFQRNQKQYRVRGNGLTSKTNLVAKAMAEKIEAEAEIQKLSQDLASLYQEQRELDVIRINTRRDLGVTIVFPGIHVQQVPTTNISQSRNGTIISTIPKLTVHPEKIATLTESDARKVLRHLDDLAATNHRRIENLQERLQHIQLAQTLQAIRTQDMINRFDRFTLFPDDYRRETFAVTASRTSVYRNRQRVGELKQAEIVAGKRSVRSTDWVELPESPGGPALVRVKDLQTEHQLLASVAKTQELTRQKISDADRRVERLLAIRDAIRRARLNLEVLLERDQRYVDLHPDKLARRRGQAVLNIPVGAIETINKHQAKKELRAFAKEAADVEKQLAVARKEHLVQQQREAALKVREAAIRAQFSNWQTQKNAVPK